MIEIFYSQKKRWILPVKYGIGRGSRAVAVLALAALGAAGCGKDEAPAPGAMAGGMRRGPRTAVVEIAPAEMGTIARRVTVSGVVEPIRTVGINSQISGAILSVGAVEGDAVRAGSVLARLDDRELRAQEASAAASHELARSNFERSERLRERQVITAAEYDRDRSVLAAAEAQLQQLRTRLDYTLIRAPITGVVTEKQIEAGDIVGVQNRLFTIAEIDTMVVRVQVSELDVVELRPGDPVAVSLDAFPGRPLTGRIRRIFPAADPATRLVPVEVALRQEGERIARAGFLARIELALGTRDNVLLVPASAVVGDAASAAVFIVQDGTALRRSVRTGMNSEGRVEILSGISPGDPVIIAGNNGLRDGAEVRVVGQQGSTIVDDSGAQRASTAASPATGVTGGNTP
jgi:RND family efflux transporter MFP subunit